MFITRLVADFIFHQFTRNIHLKSLPQASPPFWETPTCRPSTTSLLSLSHSRRMSLSQSGETCGHYKSSDTLLQLSRQGFHLQAFSAEPFRPLYCRGCLETSMDHGQRRHWKVVILSLPQLSESKNTVVFEDNCCLFWRQHGRECWGKRLHGY